jgi:pentatricopeptide repeat protein
MMDICANAGKLTTVQELFNHFRQPDAIQFSTLIKAYGNCNLANVAENALLKMLNDDNCKPSIEPFNCLINAWAISSAPDAVDRAYSVIRVLHENPKCIQFGLQPDTVSYASILKCLLHSKGANAAQRAEEILVEMERAYIDGNIHVKPNVASYHTAIKACFNAQDFDRADTILHRMEQQPDIYLNARIFNEIIHQCTLVSTAAAAIQAEKILRHMMHLSQNGKPHLKPSERLYAKVLETWLRSQDANASIRMWSICEYLMSNGYQFSGRSYSTLIPYFAKSSNPSDIEKADFLLQTMESQYKQFQDASRQPDHRFYVPLLTSYLNLNEIDKATKVLIRQAESCIGEKDPTRKESISPIPPSYLYITVAWIKSKQPDKAAMIMEKMHELCVAKQISYGPCERTWKSLIEGFERSQHPKKAYYMKRIHDIMTKMQANKISER